MNKTILILAIFAICLAPTALSAEMKENENRELAGVSLGNLKDIIGSIVGAIKNQTNNTNTNTTTPPATNNTNTTIPPASNNTNTTTPTIPPVTNNTNNTTPTTPPVTNSTNTTNSTTPTNPPVTNTTESDDSDAESSDSDAPSTNTTTPTNSTNTTNTTTPAPAPVKYAKNDVNMATFKDDCMKVHNQVRNDVGLNNLTWSDSLAASAQAWAENMAKNGFRHSGKTGENIASSTYSTKTLSRLLGLWTKEKNYYIVGCKYPSCSSTSAEVGHYTQMVWWSTTQVGCGFAPGYNRGYNYLCCQYYKAGNIRGQYVYPVPTA